jgi:lysophospholipase L1-like esterase
MRVEQVGDAVAAAAEDPRYGHKVVNASSSGETTGGALARLPRALELHRPTVVIVELGGNDGLRGLPVNEVRGNFERIFALSKAAGARVLLVAMRIPPNYGPRYTGEFEALYGDLARKHSRCWCRSSSIGSLDEPDAGRRHSPDQPSHSCSTPSGRC